MNALLSLVLVIVKSNFSGHHNLFCKLVYLLSIMMLTEISKQVSFIFYHHINISNTF